MTMWIYTAQTEFMTDLFMFVLSLDYHILDYDKNFYLFTFVEESPTKKSELNEVLKELR